MATLFRKPRSPFWYASYFDGTGYRVRHSTKEKSRHRAVVAAAAMEARARRANAEDPGKSRSILKVVEDAAELALRGKLDSASARELINTIMELSSGERLQDPSIEEWLKGWVGDKKKSRKLGTHARYEGVITSFLEFLPAAKRTAPLRTLSVADVRQFRDKLLKEGRAEATANMAVKILRNPLTIARRQGIVSNNPAEAVEMVTVKTEEKGVFSPNQVAKLVAVSGDEWKGLILAGYYTGARIGDLSNLRWKAVDLKRQAISFVQGKTSRPVEIPIHPEFKQWLDGRDDSREPDGYVFSGMAGKTMSGRNGLSGQFRLLMAKAGIAGRTTERRGEKGRNRSSLTFHSLRHSFNSAMANAGVSQELRQRLTGHAAKAINDKYTHTELETLRNAVLLVPGL